MFHIILFEPEIPPNTGNIIRLCANSGCHLHLIQPLGFAINDKSLRRAGLDYHQHTNIKQYPNLNECLQSLKNSTIYAIETCGTRQYNEANFVKGDAFLFGPETRGLSDYALKQIPSSNILKIPMLPNIRSINLSNSVAITIYEAWRQQNFGFCQN